MKRNNAILGFLVSLCLAGRVDALANRVFVSARSGNDVNSCDNINTPCQTFAGSVTQVNPGGEVIVLDSGGYGAVTITKALTIEAPPGVLAFIHPSSGDAVTVNAAGSDVVVLRGLTLNGGSGNGITYSGGGALHVENCVINGFAVNGIGFFSSGQLFVNDGIVRGNGVGIAIDHAAALAWIDKTRIENNSGSGGVNIFQGHAVVRRSVLSGNGSGLNAAGFQASQSAGGTFGFLENCILDGNTQGVIVFSSVGNSATIRVSNSTITNNTQKGINAGSTGVGTPTSSRVNNTLRDNFVDGFFVGTFAAK